MTLFNRESKRATAIDRLLDCTSEIPSEDELDFSIKALLNPNTEKELLDNMRRLRAKLGIVDGSQEMLILNVYEHLVAKKFIGEVTNASV